MINDFQNTQTTQDNIVSQIVPCINLAHDFGADDDDENYMEHEKYSGDEKDDPLNFDEPEAPKNSEDDEKKLAEPQLNSSKPDKEIRRLRKSKEEANSGKSLMLPVHEPWPDAVEGAELLNEIVSAFKCYVALPDYAAETLALWAVHSHAFEISFHTPRLVLASPEKRCGKSTCLNVLHELVSKPLTASNITSAAMFRTIEAVRPTLLIDEADTFATDNEEMRGIINSGHARNGNVIRLVGKEFEPRQFSTWCPMVLAAIGKLPVVNPRY